MFEIEFVFVFRLWQAREFLNQFAELRQTHILAKIENIEVGTTDFRWKKQETETKNKKQKTKNNFDNNNNNNNNNKTTKKQQKKEVLK